MPNAPAPWIASVELPDCAELNAPCASEAEARALFSAWGVLIDHLQLWGHRCRARLWCLAPMPPVHDDPDAGPAYMVRETYDPGTALAPGAGGPATVRDVGADPWPSDVLESFMKGV